MAERLDRFTLANILHQAARMSKNDSMLTVARNLPDLPAGWWIYPSSDYDGAQVLLAQIQDYLLCRGGGHHLIALSSRYAYEIDGHQATILVANQVENHISNYTARTRGTRKCDQFAS